MQRSPNKLGAMIRPTPLALEHLQDLRIFGAVAEEKSISRAAEQLHKAASVVTRAVVDLERSLGVPLFERKPWGMLANAYGEAVRVRAQRIQQEIQLTAEQVVKLTPSNARPSSSAIINLLLNGRKLALLDRLADLRQISAVAPLMNMTQAGISMALSRIESALGQTLFQRRMEGLVASDVTERIVTCARRVLAELRHLSSDLSAISGAPTGSVVIGATHMGRTHYLPIAIATAIAQHPGIRVTCLESPYEQLIRQLSRGEIDLMLGLRRPAPLTHGLVAELLFTDRMSIVTRKDHPLARRKGLRLAQLMNEKWIMPRINAFGMQRIVDCFHQQGLQSPDPCVQTGDLATVRQLLTAGDMLAVASPNQLKFEIQSGLLTELAVPLKETALEVVLVLRAGAMLSPATQAIVSAIRSLVREPLQ